VTVATLPRVAPAPTFNQSRPVAVRSPFRRAAAGAGDVLCLVAIVFCLPFAILAIGAPIALCVRLLLWLTGLV